MHEPKVLTLRTHHIRATIQLGEEKDVIEAEVHRNEEVIMRREYHEPSLSLETVLKQLEMYVVAEQMNLPGECLLRVRFAVGR